jgi:NAD(P)H-dependent flavin oxidoreductase YrpB (nitropropane dioxygenase family)
MKTDVCQQLDIEFPIFAFSHCRDVVAAVSRAGGMGVLGVSRHSAEELAVDLAWIAEQTKGRPFGVDLIFPAKGLSRDDATEEAIPEPHREFVAGLMKRFDVPPPSDGDSARLYSAHMLTSEHFTELAHVALKRPEVKLLVSALGSPPTEVADAARSQGVKLGALVGSPRHARRQIEAGMDILVAQGSEAGGHVGSISTMVLTPQIVDVAEGRPVLAAGGIADGRQVAAALALGAQGVWLGSVWLATVEGELQPGLLRRVIEADSEQTVVSRSYSGKPVRLLRTPWVDAWEGDDSPGTLPTPLQGLLVRDAMTSAVEHGVDAVLSTPIGQVVGMMNKQETCSAVVGRLVEQFIDATGALIELVDE